MPCAAAAPYNDYDSFQLDWDAIDHEQLTMMASSLAAWLADGKDPAFSDADGSDSPDVQGEDLDPEPVQPGATCPPQHGDTTPLNPMWFPWPDKQTCILDILQHLPHSLFSDAQLQVILWGLSVLGVDNISTARSNPNMGFHQSDMKVHWATFITLTTSLPSLHKWLYEIDPAIAMPMIHKGQQDSYVFGLMKLMDGTMVVPEHWYMKPSARSSPPFGFEYWVHTWHAHPVVSSHTCGYVIHTYDTIEVLASNLLLSFPHLLHTYQMDGQPDPCNIIGLIETRGCGVLPWVYTDPAVGNRWHMWAQGHRILSYMIWLYCDNTSGNMSKKWNKHNSFLFTAAGLPHVMVHKESSIHFLAMSNIAPPIEMLDRIVDQLKHAQMYGIWAWDIEGREMVLVIPAILAMLGDNPMQSELACHVGLQGNLFCRNCWVQGAGADLRQCPDLTGRVLTNADNDTHSIETGSHATDSDGSMHKDAMHQLKHKGCHSETMQDLAD
ncbi:hypothetical protein EDC04DRAFT_2992741 [Pisolithus marmoratus]|nr:hypothetical protein EDC04DRAFT_2992741 [Pisolithus marmoratus]